MLKGKNAIITGASRGIGKEIAEKLFISYDTVRTHRQNIIAKSASKNILQIISQAIREGLI